MQVERQAQAPELQRSTTREKDSAAAPDRYGALDEAGRQAEAERGFRAGSERVTEPAASNYDRDADNRAWEDRIAKAAIAGAQEGRQQGEPGREGEKAPPTAQGRAEDQAPPEPAPEQQQERPLGQTAGDIRMAWATSRSVNELEEALAARGISLAEVSAEEARASERSAAFAKEVGNFASTLREGEIVAVNRHGDIYRLDQRTTGDQAPEIEARLARLDRVSLLSVADTTEVMREAARETWKDEQRAAREEARPASGIETTIADALIGTIDGPAFADELDEAGVTIARATDRDVAALDALREDAALEATVAFANGEMSGRNAFPQLWPGDLAAVTASGAVFRLSPEKLDFEDIEQRLAAVDPKGLPSIVEARAQSEIDREQTAEFWAEARAQNAEARAASNDAFDGERAFRRHTAAAEHGVESAIHTADDAIDAGMHAATRGMSSFAKAVEKALSGIFSFFGLGEPKLTPMQRELAAKAEEELAEARAWRAAEQQNEASRDWEIFEKDRRQQQDEHERNLGYREDPGRERERERY